MKKYFYFLLLLFLLLVISNCSNSTQVSKGSLSGTVHLEGEPDHSEITVAVYELAYLDTTIVRINSQYPHIGVIINQHTEFDHRFQSPVKYTETDFEGNFLLKKITVGEYNIVALKDSFGFKYIYDFEIEKDENQLTPQPPLFKPIEGEQKRIYSSMRTDADIILFAEHHLSGDITDDWVFETDHHYIIGEEGVNSTNFTPGTNLEIQPGAIIRIEPGNDLKIYGNLFAQGEENNMFWITSNDGFALNDASSNFQFSIFNFKFDRSEELLQYNSMELSSIASVSDDLLSWGKFDYANTCLLNQVNNLHLQNGVFRDSRCGFKSTNVDSTFCANLINKTCLSEIGSINYNFTTSGTIEKNIIIQANIGIMLDNESSPLIKNNFIECFNEGVFTRNNCFSEIKNNAIICDNIGISIRGDCDEQIYYNNINASIGVLIPPTGYYGSSNAIINYNNIQTNNYAIKILGTQWGPNINDINAINNFFYTMNEEEIQEFIFDKNDVIEQAEYYNYTGIVNYIPYLTQEYPNAGIQKD